MAPSVLAPWLQAASAGAELNPSIRVGTRVQLAGLNAKELNGKAGTVVADNDVLARGRIPVVLEEDGGTQVNVKPENVVALAEDSTKRRAAKAPSAARSNRSAASAATVSAVATSPAKVSALAKKRPRQKIKADVGEASDMAAPIKRKKVDALKLPRGAYGCFFEKNRAKLTQLCEGLPMCSLMILAGKRWKQLSDAEREPYQREFQERKKKYEEAKLRQVFAKARRARRRAKIKDDEDPADEEDIRNLKLAPIEKVQPVHSCGTEVLLGGLSGAIELNGQRAKVESFDVALGRYVVHLDQGSEMKRVRPDNVHLFFKIGDDVVVKSPHEMAGMHANIIDYDTSTKKYFVRAFETGDQKEFLPEHLTSWFPSETDVILQGLQRLPELNGQLATVKGYEEQAGRYLVLVGSSGATRECKRVRPENVWLRLPNASDALFEGTRVQVVNFDRNTHQYLLRLPQSSTQDQAKQSNKFRPNRVWITARVDVVVKGLQRVPELNGQRARIEGYDETDERYLVRFASRRAVPGNSLTPESSEVKRVQPRHLCRWFEPGSEVLIQGLSQKFDGEQACVDKFLSLRSTYIVRLTKNSELKQVQPENLCSWYGRGMKVLVNGFPQNPDLNGHLAKVVGFDNKESRYLVQMVKTSKKKLLRPDHLQAVLIPGSRVMIDGLLLSPELNRQVGKVVRFDDSHGRYIVSVVGSSDVKRIRAENLFPRDDESDDEVDTPAVNGARENAGGDRSDKEDTDSMDSVDVLKRQGGDASPDVSSSSSSSDDGFGATPKKKKRPNDSVSMPFVLDPNTRSFLRSVAEKTVREAERRVMKEEAEERGQEDEGETGQT